MIFDHNREEGKGNMETPLNWRPKKANPDGTVGLGERSVAWGFVVEGGAIPPCRHFCLARNKWAPKVPKTAIFEEFSDFREKTAKTAIIPSQ